MTPEEQSLSPLYERVEHAARTVRARFDEDVRTGVVLGSGLGAFADDLEDSVVIPYEEIPGFARPTVEGHAGRLVMGRVSGSAIAVLQGRFHFYEGYSRDEVTFPMRVFGLMGIKSVVLTNAAGGINIGFDQGSLMIISDHLNLMCTNALLGPNDERFGARFPDMSEVYSREFQEIAVEEARSLGLELRRGVYAAMSGPSYETPAEVRMLRTLGADAVGMSTVPEAVVARQMGMRVLGISCITNMAAGVVDQPINHEEVMETGAQVRDTIRNLLRGIIPRLSTV
ncbi:MAG TPA: purine-nucleoside phosphorylase [Pyrinomonadaceae bacterium]|jgi:purine-nucleoside phosphorylase